MLDAPIRDLDQFGIERDGGGETVPGPALKPELPYAHAPMEGGRLVAAAELPGKHGPRIQFQGDCRGRDERRLEEGTPFFEIVGGDGERERFCRGSGRYDLGKRSVRRDGGMRRPEITIGQVEDQAASVFERATSRATYRKPVGRRPRRCLQSEVKIRFQAFPRPDQVALRPPSATEAGCTGDAKRGGVPGERSRLSSRT